MLKCCLLEIDDCSNDDWNGNEYTIDSEAIFNDCVCWCSTTLWMVMKNFFLLFFFLSFLFFSLFLRLDFNRQKQNKNKYKHTIRLHTALQTNTSWFYMLTNCVIFSLATWSKHVLYTAQLIEQVHIHIITYTDMHITHTHTFKYVFGLKRKKEKNTTTTTTINSCSAKKYKKYRIPRVFPHSLFSFTTEINFELYMYMVELVCVVKLTR